MDWCVTFPRENYIVSRPSLRKACGDNRNAGKFLSYLLFRASVREESKTEAKHINEVRKQQGLDPSQDDSITIYRTQGQIVHEMDDEISARTLRDEAVPCLIELGYLKIEEFRGKNQYTAYTLLPEAIQHGINHPEEVPHFKTMVYYQQSGKTTARKNFRSEKFPNGSEKFPNGSEKFPNPEHEPLGKNSDPKSGNESASEAISDGVHKATRYRDSNKEIERKEGTFIPSLPYSTKLEQISTSDVDNSVQIVDKQTSDKVHVSPVSPIAMMTTGNTSQGVYNCTIPKKLDFSPEERKIQEWWCAQKNLVVRPPKCTEKLKEHWSELAKYIHSLEEMTSLCQYAKAAIRDNPNRKDKTVYPGNLVDYLDRWKQAQAPFKQPDKKQSTIIDPLIKMRAIGAQFMSQGVS